jgi:hypothetical protein
MIKKQLATTLFTLILTITACSQRVDYGLPGYSNQGILPLSIDDAYNGANLFISREMENSPYLYRFIESHGAPDAIEVVDRKFEDSKVHLFYLQERAVYSMVASDTEKVRQWVVRGPFQMNWKDIRELSRLNRNKYTRPNLVVWGREMRFKEAPQQPVAQVITPVIPPPPPPKPKVIKRPVIKEVKETPKPTISKEEEMLTLDPTKFKPLNTDQQAILMSQGYAGRADNGDAMHLVKSETETISKVAKWYTQSESNADTISAVNHLNKEDKLAVGTIVRIPISILKQIKTMPIGYE